MTSSNKFAIIGIGCRFPGGIKSLDELWDALSNGKDMVTEIPADRFDKKRYYHPDRKQPARTCTVSAGVISGIKEFDNAFWGMSPKEAEALDPQQRLMLEMTWEAFEDAGIRPSSVAGTDVGVFVGAASTDMGLVHSDDLALTGPYSMTGTSLSIISNRLSYTFDLKGPSMTIDTACSSSLVALNEACRAIETDSLSMAIVGGVNVLLSPVPFIGFSKAHMLSARGRCQVFDQKGDGYVRAEGGAVVLIKSLEKAEADHDKIYAVIEGIGVNSDGRTNGIALPNEEAQKALLKSVYARAGVHLDDLSYVEAHGTGTAAGDPIEARSIGTVLGRSNQDNPLWVGSVKSNLGHLETGSGMAGLAKALLIIQHHCIPKNLHFEHPNEAIDFSALGIKVPTDKVSLPINNPVLVGVNSFGFGGTNAHVILKEYQSKEDHFKQNEEGILPLLLSARSEDSLINLVRQYAELLKGISVKNYNRIAKATIQQRELFTHRLMIKAESVDEIWQELSNLLQNGIHATTNGSCFLKVSPNLGKTALVFSGNGSQWKLMGADLYKNNDLFKRSIDEVDFYFYPLAHWKIGEYLQQLDSSWDLEHTEYAQPLLFAIQVGMITLLKHEGVTFEAVVGHSVGEVAASFAAGIFDLPQAVKIIYERSRAQASTFGSGSMAAVKIKRESLNQLLSQYKQVEIAGINTADSFTVSGDEAEIVELGQTVKSMGGLFKKLDLAYAFHSSKMQPLKTAIYQSLEYLEPSKEPFATFFSTVTGAEVNCLDLRKDYWWKNIRQPVRFEDAVVQMLQAGYRLFIEVGPHSILSGYIKQIGKQKQVSLEVLPLMKKGDTAEIFTKNCLKAYLSTVQPTTDNQPIDHRVSLPHYCWNRKKCWPEPTALSYHLFETQKLHPLLGRAVSHAQWTWENELDLTTHPWLSGHEIDETVLFPAAGFLELAMAAGREVIDSNRHFEVDNFQIFRPLPLQENNLVLLRTEVSAQGILSISSKAPLSEQGWVTHVKARITPTDAPHLEKLDLARLNTKARKLDVESLYNRVAKLGLNYKGAFCALEQAYEENRSYIVQVQSRDPLADETMSLSPALVDGVLQSLFFLLNEENNTSHSYLPTWFGKTQVWKFGLPTFGVVRLRKSSEFSLVADFELYDRQGESLACLYDVRFRRVRHGHRDVFPCFYGESWFDLPQFRLTSYLSEKQGSSLREFISSELEHPASNEIDADWIKLSDVLRVSLAFESVIEFDHWTTAESLFTQAFSTEHEHYCQYLAQMLSNYGLAEKDEDLYRVASGQTFPLSDTIVRTMIAKYPAYWADVLMMTTAGHHIKELMDDRVSLDSILPQAKSALWQQIRQTPSENRLRQTILKVLKQAIASVGSQKRLRVGVIINRFSDFAWAVCRYSDQIDLTIGVSDPSALERIRQEFSAQRGISIVEIGSQMESISDMYGQDMLLAVEDFSQIENFSSLIKKFSSLLFEGGELLLVQSIPQGISDFVKGMSPTWWQHSDSYETVSSLLDAKGWRQLLELSGFEQVCIYDQVWMNQRLLVVARRQPEQVAQTKSVEKIKSLGIILEKDNPLQKTLADELVEIIHSQGVNVQVVSSFGLNYRPQRWLSLLDIGSDDLSAPTSTLVWIKQLAQAEESTDMVCLSLGEQQIKAKALQGLLRVLSNEAPHIKPSYLLLMDRSHESLLKGVEVLLQETLSAQEYRVDKVTVQGMQTKQLAIQNSFSNVKRLTFEVPGKLDRLVWQDIQLPNLDKGQVCIRVKATGLNFRDVMWAMGMLPEEALENGFSGPSLGLECSGVIEALGNDVSDLKVGDEVIAFAPSCFSTYVVTDQSAVYRKPAHLKFEQAASIPVAFFTAWYAIKHLGRARHGEKILIHGAAGGVGLAALQIASLLGLEVFATAGSEVKRQLLRSLGVEHVYDSRSLAFADQILADTNGGGVDLVLNSLAGQGAEKSLTVLSPFGRFLELGKRDFFEDSPLFLRPFRRNLSYFGIDVDQLLVQQPTLTKDLFTEMLGHFESRALRPLPYLVYSSSDVVKAFQAMQASQHIGKIVVSYKDAEIKNQRYVTKKLEVRNDRTYLITGGLGGLGLVVANDLVEKGAKSLILASRRTELTSSQAKAVDQIRKRGVLVHILCADVSSDDFKVQAKNLISTLIPLGGVIHAAGVLSDAMLVNQTEDSFEKVWNPKVKGLVNLDHLAREYHSVLDFFIVFSSATTLLGNPGQGNYVAANFAMEAIIENRLVDGEPATLIGWGPVGDVGMLKQNDQARQSLEKLLGARPITSKEVLQAIRQAFECEWGLTHYCAIDWDSIRHLPMGSHLRLKPMMRAFEKSTVQVLSLAEVLADKTVEEAIDFLSQEVRQAIAGIMGVATSELSDLQPISEIGMDSLMMVELSMVLEERLGVKVPAVSLSGGASIRTIAEHFYKVSFVQDSTDQMVDVLQAQHGVNLRQNLKEQVMRDARK